MWSRKGGGLGALNLCLSESVELSEALGLAQPHARSPK